MRGYIVPWLPVAALDGGIFNGGMFKNGGFEDGIANWKLYPTNGSWTATPDANTAQNIPNTTGTHLYQDFTLEAGVTYELSARQVSGDGTLTYCINTADSGIPISDGATRFIGVASPESIGVTMSVAGALPTPAVVDNLRLIKINFCQGANLCLTVGKNPLAETYGYAPHATTPYGSLDPLDFMGVDVYNFIFNATSGVNGCSLGVAGNDKIQDIDFFSATFNNYVNNPITFVWDESQTRYRSDSLVLAEFVRDNLGLNIGVVVVPSTFDPLEDHPYWTFRSGEGATVESSLSWADNKIAKTITGTGADCLISLGDLGVDTKFYDMEVSAHILAFNPSGQQTYYPLVVRAVDHDNYVGLRSGMGVLEVFEYVGGVERSLMNSAYSNTGLTEFDTITLRVEGTAVTVLVNGSSVGVYNQTTITDAGYLGLVDRKGTQDRDFASDYTAIDIRMAYIGGNVPAGGTTVYLAFDNDVGGDIVTGDVVISVDGVPSPHTTFDVTGSQLVLGMTTAITAGQTVTATIDGLGSNVPGLVDAAVTNNA